MSLLEAHHVRCVVDVRRLPRSKRHPHFDQGALAAALAATGLGYRHVPNLGGMRKPVAGSVNAGLREPMFQGYADHMQTSAFTRALAEVIELGRRERVALMCAEASPSNCHRAMIADALVALGHGVEHVVDGSGRAVHRLDPGARIEAGRVTYPSPQMRLGVER